MPKVTGIRLVVQIAETWVVGSTINRLALDVRLVPCHSGRNFFAIDGNGLSDAVLLQLAGIDDPELEALHAAETDSRVPKVLRGHSQGRGAGLMSHRDC